MIDAYFNFVFNWWVWLPVGVLLYSTITFIIGFVDDDEPAKGAATIMVMAFFWPVVLPLAVAVGLLVVVVAGPYHLGEYFRTRGRRK